MDYLSVKSLHVYTVMVTVLLFNLRFAWRTWRPDRTMPALLRILPHINDTLLLLLGLALMYWGGWSLWGNALWLGVKLLLLLAYIACGMQMFRQRPRSPAWFGIYALAMLCVVGMYHLAVWKPV